MKTLRILTGLAALTPLAAVIAAPTAPAAKTAETPVFHADFGIFPIGGPAEYWMVKSGAWTMADGQPHAYQASADGKPAVSLIMADVTDGSVQTTAQADAKSAPSLLVRWRDDDDYERAGYDPAAQAWRIWRCTKGTETALATGPKAALGAKAHTIKVTFQNNALALTVDAQAQCQAKDPAKDALYLSGAVGLRADGPACRFTEFAVAKRSR